MDQLEHDDQELIDDARRARERSYVPYSGFRMGASVRTEDGSVLPGAVVENVSLGLAMCAERVALFGSISAGDARPIGLALVAPRTDGRLTYPCGACLQVALELGGPGCGSSWPTPMEIPWSAPLSMHCSRRARKGLTCGVACRSVPVVRHVALLRGIGPGNPKMRNAELVRVLSSVGLRDVTAVISSGNFIFDSGERDRSVLAGTHRGGVARPPGHIVLGDRAQPSSDRGPLPCGCVR